MRVVLSTWNTLANQALGMTFLDGKNIINETIFTIFHYALDGATIIHEIFNSMVTIVSTTW
jgi:hypothetical protein